MVTQGTRSLIRFPYIHIIGGVIVSNSSSKKRNMNKVGDNKEKDSTSKFCWSDILKKALIYLPLIASITTIGSVLVSFGRISEKIDGFGSDIEEIRKSISDMRQEINDASKDVSALKARADATEKSLDMLNQTVFSYRPTIEFASKITMTYSGVDAPYYSGIVTLGSATKIVYSKNIPGQEYTAAQLAEQPLFLPYVEDGKEVYFYGQVDENGCWDGHCIVNIYENDKLTLITDAQYDSGKLLSFQQAFPDSLPNGDDIWSVSNRIMKDGFSEGETWRYFRDGDYTKEFTIDGATLFDILDVDTFKAEYADTEEGYYHGNISGGSYNDDTGRAYYVQYFRDGTVKTLYVGKFVQGNFDDMTGMAWMLGKKNETATYSYYNGTFKNGKATKDPNCWEEPLTIDRVCEIVAQSGMQFNCELKWEHDRA